MDTDKTPEPSYFAAVAAAYDRLQPIVAGPSYQAGLEMLVELIPFAPANPFDFVELGCGTAEPTARVLAAFPQASGLCLDSEAEMLQLAQKKLATFAQRATLQQGNMATATLPACDVAFSAKAFHHVAPADKPPLLARIAKALRPGGCFILYDGMAAGPSWDKAIRGQSRRIYQAHVDAAIAAGQTTQAEIDARWTFKKEMKAAGKDVEYPQSAAELLAAMSQAGFVEVGMVWRMFTDTILVGFVP